MGQVRTGQFRTGQVGTGQVLTWDCTKIKMKTYTWNLSVTLLRPTCFFILVHINTKNAKDVYLRYE